MNRFLASLSVLTLGAFASAQCFESNLGTAIGLGDDSLLPAAGVMASGLTGGFPFGGTNYADIRVSTNGFLYLSNANVPAAGSASLYGTAATMITNLRTGSPKIAPFLRDLNITAANTGQVFVNNTFGNKCVITWKNFVEFSAVLPVRTVQCQLFNDGTIAFFYSANCTVAASGAAALAGISPGALPPDPGPSNLSSPFVSLVTTVYETFTQSPSNFDLAGQVVTFSPSGTGYSVSASPCVPASHTAYGAGCVPQMRSWYENFATGAADLTGKTVTATQNLLGGYDVSTTALGTYNTPSGLALGLALTDDSVSTQPLPFTFDYPGGSTASITIDSNGRVHLAAAGSTDFSPTVTELLTSATAMLCPAWQDNLPDGAANINNVFIETISATEVDVTWFNVPTFSGGGVGNYQLALIDNGTNDSVEFRYQQLQNTGGSAIVGFSTGGASLDPGNRDLSAGGNFSTVFPEGLGPLTLSAAPAPVLGTNVTWTVGNIRANASLSAIFMSFGQTAPVPLGTIGLNSPGCSSHLDQSPSLGYTALSTLLMLNPTDTCTVAIPTGAAWAGVDVYTQAASLSPLDVPSGVITSNGLRSRLQTF